MIWLKGRDEMGRNVGSKNGEQAQKSPISSRNWGENVCRNDLFRSMMWYASFVDMIFFFF